MDAGAAALQGPVVAQPTASTRPSFGPASYLLKGFQLRNLTSIEIKPVGITDPREGVSTCRSGASKVCPGIAGFTWGRRFKQDPLCQGMKRALGHGGWKGFVS